MYAVLHKLLCCMCRDGSATASTSGQGVSLLTRQTNAIIGGLHQRRSGDEDKVCVLMLGLRYGTECTWQTGTCGHQYRGNALAYC